MSMRCREIMRKHFESVAPDESVAFAATRMLDQKVGFLPVTTDDERVVGVVTDRDIVLRVCAAGLPADETLVRDAMTASVVACRTEDDVEAAIETMAAHQKLRLLVLDDADRLVGVISWTDIAQTEEPMRVARLVRDVTAREYRVRSVRP
jgi:CBS domain-containing protein